MNTEILDKNLVIEDNLTVEEYLIEKYRSYYPFPQNGKIIKIWSILVTPELAEYFLKRNTKNRPISKSNVNFLVKEITSGAWREISDPIQISTNDVILNGQHRLTAIVKAKIPVFLRVETNIDESIFTVIDTGKKRTGTDALGIEKVDNAVVASTTIRFIHEIIGLNKNLTNQEMVDYYDANHDRLKESIRFGVSNYKKGEKLIPPTLLGAFHFLITENYPEKGLEFLTKFAIGSNIEKGCPTLPLRARFVTLRTDAYKNGRTEANFKYVTLAWNKFVKGEKTTKLTMPTEVPALIR